MAELKDAIIKHINKVLEGSWSEDECRLGKKVYCLNEWRRVIPAIKPLYEEHGWIVEKSVLITASGRQFFLNIKNPNWLKK